MFNAVANKFHNVQAKRKLCVLFRIKLIAVTVSGAGRRPCRERSESHAARVVGGGRPTRERLRVGWEGRVKAFVIHIFLLYSFTIHVLFEVMRVYH